MILWDQIMVWKKLSNRGMKMINLSLLVKIIGQWCKRVRPHKNDVLLSSVTGQIKIWTQTQPISSQLKSQIVSIKKTIMLHDTRDEIASILNDLPIISLRAWEVVTNTSRKTHFMKIERLLERCYVHWISNTKTYEVLGKSPQRLQRRITAH